MGQTVVVIDDDDITLDIMVSIIEDSFDATVYSFTDAKTALSFLTKDKAESVNLLITDVNMPRFTGLELLAKVRQLKMSTAVLLISAEVTRESAVIAKKFSAAGFVVKPFEKQTLVDKISPILSA